MGRMECKYSMRIQLCLSIDAVSFTVHFPSFVSTNSSVLLFIFITEVTFCCFVWYVCACMGVCTCVHPFTCFQRPERVRHLPPLFSTLLPGERVPTKRGFCSSWLASNLLGSGSLRISDTDGITGLCS